MTIYWQRVSVLALALSISAAAAMAVPLLRKSDYAPPAPPKYEIFYGTPLAPPENSVVTDRELAIGGVTLGETENSAITKLGKPLRRTDNGESVELEYQGMTVWVGWLEQARPNVPRRVYELLSTSNNRCTPSGICPGGGFDQVVAKLGTPIVVDREGGQFMEYFSSQSACWLQISVTAGIIQSVRAECQP
jgi:hypothetical protein